MRPNKKNLALSTLPQTASMLHAVAARYAKLVKNRGRRNSSDSSVRSPTSTSTDVRSPTKTRTATSTDAYTAGNITVTGGAGAGATTVIIRQRKASEDPRGGVHAPRNTDKSNKGRTLAQWKKMRDRQDAKLEKVRRDREARAAKSNCGKVQQYRLNLGRKNPADAAAERYEYFHGRPPANETVVKTPIQRHGVLSGIGELKELVILAIAGDRQVKLEGFKGALLAETEKGTQLYIKGGDQSVSLKDFGISQAHEAEILGALLNVVYFTTKDHLQPKDGGTANYKHKFGKGRTVKYAFGKKGARLPMVGYDTRNKLLSIQGGTYKIVAEGIDG